MNILTQVSESHAGHYPCVITAYRKELADVLSALNIYHVYDHQLTCGIRAKLPIRVLQDLRDAVESACLKRG